MFAQRYGQLVKNKRAMRNKFILVILLSTFLCTTYSFGQKPTFNLIKLGVKGFCGITAKNNLNNISSDWLDKVVEVSHAELSGEPISIPFNIEYGYQPFLLIRPLRLLQIGCKMDFSYSNLTAKFENQFINQDYQFNVKTRSYLPGIFAYLTLGKFELGGGLFQSYTNIYINDNFFGYQDTWYGSNTGYEISIGFSTTKEKLVGFTMDIRYRGLIVNSLKDSFNRNVTYTTQDNFSLNMSGFIIDMGLYFQFIKLKKKNNEK